MWTYEANASGFDVMDGGNFVADVKTETEAKRICLGYNSKVSPEFIFGNGNIMIVSYGSPSGFGVGIIRQVGSKPPTANDDFAARLHFLNNNALEVLTERLFVASEMYKEMKDG